MLRRDFRRYYHCCYDEVEPDEALDLIAGLPAGSEWAAGESPWGAWPDWRREMVKIEDLLKILIWGMGIYSREAYPDEPPRTPRPEDALIREAEAKRVREAHQKITQGQWEEV